MALRQGGRVLSTWWSRTSIRPCSRLQHVALFSSDVHSTAPGEDPFTLSLQSKTEDEVFSLLEKARQQQQQQQDEEDEDLVDTVNPETGEVMGPRGKEPTRYGDWEVKGRATDFS